MSNSPSAFPYTDKNLKAEELEGAELDAWAARAEGLEHAIHINRNARALLSPSTLWSEAGPIIEREQIALEYRADAGLWFAAVGTQFSASAPGACFTGATPLIAAMRAYVAKRFA